MSVISLRPAFLDSHIVVPQWSSHLQLRCGHPSTLPILLHFSSCPWDRVGQEQSKCPAHSHLRSRTRRRRELNALQKGVSFLVPNFGENQCQHFLLLAKVRLNKNGKSNAIIKHLERKLVFLKTFTNRGIINQ